MFSISLVFRRGRRSFVAIYVDVSSHHRELLLNCMLMSSSGASESFAFGMVKLMLGVSVTRATPRLHRQLPPTSGQHPPRPIPRPGVARRAGALQRSGDAKVLVARDNATRRIILLTDDLADTPYRVPISEPLNWRRKIAIAGLKSFLNRR